MEADPEPTQEELAAKLALVRRQQDELRPHIKTVFVTCGGCERRVSLLVNAYRCLYCAVWYCAACAGSHFGGAKNDCRNRG